MGHLTLGWLTLIGASPAEVITAAAAAEFSSVSIRVTGRKLADPFPPVVGNPAAVRELRQRLADGGLRLSNTSTYHLSPDVRLTDLLPVIETTAELRADTMVVTCLDPDEARWVDFAAAYCEAAAAAKLQLALEFVPYSEARTVEQANRLVSRVGAQNFGLLVDSLHLDRSGGTPASLGAVDPGRIFFAQLCDARRQRPARADLATEARTGRLYPGDGALPLHEFLDALPADIEIECETPQMAYADLSPVEQARRAGEATRRFLAAHQARAHSAGEATGTDTPS